MRKNPANIKEHCKHIRNARGLGKRGVNKRIRKALKLALKKD